ncbi:MAG: hypothetical protein ACXV8J_04345, partial [Methylobacter sp.]
MNRKDRGELSYFIDLSYKWRALLEAWGTFLLVLVSAGAVVVSEMTGQVSKEMEVIAPGLMVMVIIYFMGAVS